MAVKSYKAAYQKYLGDKIANVSNETTEEEIKCIYAERSPNYDKVVDKIVSRIKVTFFSWFVFR